MTSELDRMRVEYQRLLRAFDILSRKKSVRVIVEPELVHGVDVDALFDIHTSPNALNPLVEEQLTRIEQQFKTLRVQLVKE